MLNSKYIIIGIVSLIIGCAQVDQAKLLSNNQVEAIAEIEELSEVSRSKHFDLLANDQYKNGVRKLNHAIVSDREDLDKEVVLKELSESKAYFLDAQKVAQNRKVIPERLISAREATLNNRVRSDVELLEKLNDVDSAVRSETKDFTKVLSVDMISKFEKQYFRLEISATQNNVLRSYREIVMNAKYNNAEKLAPKTYRKTSNYLRAAENMIQQSPRNPENFSDSVLNVDKSAMLLNEVMIKLKGSDKGSSEETVLSLVKQEKKLGALVGRTEDLQNALVSTQNNLGYVSYELKNRTIQQRRSQDKINLQVSMNNVQSNFTKEEAEVYQQGSNIIIRLKKFDFSPGSSQIPENSKEILAKINRAISDLHSSNIIVQGHTDSTGRNGTNLVLSLKRSEAVSKYLSSLENSYEASSVGLGESIPIANNQTRLGRAMNRRVDIIIRTQAGENL